MIKKYFIITIDTEADNQWDYSQKCTTQNSKYLPKFQELAEKYNFKPVWLTTYEMANDSFFVKYFKSKQDNNLCEIGMHLHAWNTPPDYDLKRVNNERPYLIEYPEAIMEKKIYTLDSLLEKKFGIKPISHRSGRWATNDTYFKLLKKYGYSVDCSVTPHVNWNKCLGQSGIEGTNYEKYSEKPYLMFDNFMEFPVTIRKVHFFSKNNVKNFISFAKECVHYLIGRNQWLRPDRSCSFDGIKSLIDKCNNKNDNLMFMIHSSELMPGGSPNFKNENDIQKLYVLIDNIFAYAKEMGYVGITLRDYYERMI